MNTWQNLVDLLLNEKLLIARLFHKLPLNAKKILRAVIRFFSFDGKLLYL
jgi:hypothetical protein